MARRWCGTLKHTTPIRRRTEDRSLSPRSEPDSRLSSANTDFQSPKRAIDSRAGVPMSGSNTLALVFVLVLASVVRADGCKFRSDGRFVPEREQLALVEWADGVETLHVATRSDSTASGTVWVVPVRGPARSVRAEPVEVFPVVVYYETLKGRAERTLKDLIVNAGLLDSGGLCCVALAGGCDDKAARQAAEASRVEQLGMVVTVVSAETRDALGRYLDAQGVNPATADLSSLDEYFGQPEYAFVCGWVA